jgi:hypothetical protein
LFPKAFLLFLQTKAYEAGNENTQTTSANNSVAIVAGTVAVSAVVLGFSALSGRKCTYY